MGKIGDYIHYHARNYKIYGISKQGEGKYTSWYPIHDQLLKNYKKENNVFLTQQEKEEIENAINSLKNNSQNNQNIKTIQDEIEKILIKQFEQAVKGVIWQSASIDKGGIKEGVGGVKKINLNKIELLLDRVNQLETFLSKPEFQTSSVKIKEEINNVKQNYINLLSEISDDLKNKGWDEIVNIISTNSEITNNLNFHGTKALQIKASKAREALQDLITLYAKIPPYNLAQGTLFEYMIAVLPQVARNKAIFDMNKILKNRVKGNLTEEVKFNQNFFDSQYLTDNLKKGLIKTESSQGKIDVTLTWNNKDLNISAKNVSIKDSNSNIHILSGSNLLFLLQDVNQVFVNHLLNIYATHKHRNKKGQSYSNWFQQERKNILIQLKMILFLKALTGFNYGRKAANIFMVNDIMGHDGGIKVIVMSELIQKIYQNYSNIQYIHISEGEGKPLLGRLFKNDWEGNEFDENFAQQRISALLQDVHSRKISIKFSPGIIYSGLSNRFAKQ